MAPTFQSTHPMRGATRKRIRTFATVGISIHAPHAGCDKFCYNCQSLLALFQSTHPMRGATGGVGFPRRNRFHFNPRTPCGVRPFRTPLIGVTRIFQSTHPMRGATTMPSEAAADSEISIHAPHAGCDHDRHADDHRHRYFNPRTPCGVRPVCSAIAPIRANFNPRTPCGVRRNARAAVRLTGRISIHAPHAGCDFLDDLMTIYFFYFNPRTPCGVRQDPEAESTLAVKISIHAPARGATLLF